jgi:hypothetical protein
LMLGRVRDTTPGRKSPGIGSAPQADGFRSLPCSFGQQTFEVVVAHAPPALLILELPVGSTSPAALQTVSWA